LAAETKDYEEKVGEYQELFLDYDGSKEIPRVLLAAFPRSGSSLFRKLLGEVSGIVTGSDFNPESISCL